jgi:hypothetical protein
MATIKTTTKRNANQRCSARPAMNPAKVERMAFTNAQRLRRHQRRLTGPEYNQLIATLPRFDWAGLREKLQAGGAGEDDPIVRLCREREAEAAAAAKAVR